MTPLREMNCFASYEWTARHAFSPYMCVRPITAYAIYVHRSNFPGVTNVNFDRNPAKEDARDG
jgi:hypothetical protein